MSDSDSRQRLVVGCMTGTSIDGIDVALVAITGHGRDLRADLLDHAAADFPDDLRRGLLDLAAGAAMVPAAIAQLAGQLGRCHATTIADLLAGRCADLVCAHGQTIYHDPDGAGGSWQLFDPWPVVAGLQVPVIYDLRQADINAGGQGAPITPLADPILYRQARGQVLNLGGIGNISWWQAEDIIGGGDVGPCNLLIDGVVGDYFPALTFDCDGAIAAAGRVVEPAADAVSTRIAAAGRGHRSLGREQFGADFRAALRVGPLAGLAAADAVACVTEAVARCLGRTLAQRPDLPAILAGGGARNRHLAARIASHAAGVSVTDSAHHGVPVQVREAMAFAVLGAVSQDGVPITVPAITGAAYPALAGTWAYPTPGER
ncbi:MAG: anhydro-N-acetylmuramic acid kinase [Planctomycetota bacterium]|jgi:1,6-anhydro-N-acetylmuramate kinase